MAGWFVGQTPASFSQTDYLYSPAYKDIGILGLPIESRVLDPATNSVIAKTQTLYDEYDLIQDGSSAPNFVLPPGNTVTPLRGNPTTTRTWVKETNGWLNAHAQYNNFGSGRKQWDVSGDTTKFTETQYSPAYQYAYPTKIIAPAARSEQYFGDKSDF